MQLLPGYWEILPTNSKCHCCTGILQTISIRSIRMLSQKIQRLKTSRDFIGDGNIALIKSIPQADTWTFSDSHGSTIEATHRRMEANGCFVSTTHPLKVFCCFSRQEKSQNSETVLMRQTFT